MKKKKYLLVVFIIMVLALLIGTTYALWPWWSDENQKTNVSFTTGTGFSCSADGGGNISSSDVTLIPTNCTNDPYVIRRTITTNVTKSISDNVYLDLWLDIKNIDTELSNTQNFMYALTDSATSCTSGNILASGNFNGKTNNQKVDLLINDTYTSTGNKTYYLYIWLDYAERGNLTMNKDFHLELNGECTDVNPGTPNSPELVDNLIPVKLSDSGDTVKAISSTNTSWYNYNQKKWANAVLVDSTHRSNYQNLSSNEEVTIPESEILAYYVWIPRYSYQVWTYTGNDTAGNPREIPIKFVDTNTIDTATQIGDWHTHPAFTFGDKELTGIWVGKFEVSHTSYVTTGGSVECTSSSCASNKYNNLRILPNVRALTNNTVSNFFFVSRAMETSGNSFGINASTTDSHMMKNSEWGAAAYLSHSKYGINDEIRINNTSVTGCGAGTPNEAKETTCDIRYRSVSSGIYPQSTTGNVTGIFDMSGGMFEFVMGTYNNSNNYSTTASGFTSSNLLPNAKYYDNYANPPFTGASNTAGFTQCTLATCGGHALNETKSWYGDNAVFVTSSVMWFRRGGSSSDKSIAGAFSSNYKNGNWGDDISARLVLLADNEQR